MQIASVAGGQGAGTGKAAEAPVREAGPSGAGMAVVVAGTGCCKLQAGEE